MRGVKENIIHLTAITLLYWGTFDSAIRTVDATITFFGF